MEFETVVQGLKGYIRDYAEEMLTKSKSKDSVCKWSDKGSYDYDNRWWKEKFVNISS